jgi:nucleotide-binding universal stress UspA family protein
VVLVRLRDRAAQTPVRMERVLVPLDGSERSQQALEPAVLVARRLSLPVIVIYVMEVSDLSSVYGTTLNPSAVDALIKDEDEAIRESLNLAVEKLKTSGVHAGWKILSGGWAAQEIEDEVGPNDVVVMASHGRGGVRRWLFGSVAERLVRSGRAPVMLVPSID